MTGVSGDLYKSAPQYAVFAKEKGSAHGVTMPMAFGVRDSEEEQWAQVELRLRADPDFREKFKGHSFLVARVDQCIEVTKDGLVRIYRNERKSIGVLV